MDLAEALFGAAVAGYGVYVLFSGRVIVGVQGIPSHDRLLRGTPARGAALVAIVVGAFFVWRGLG